MQSDAVSRRTKNKPKWHKVKRVSGLYDYLPSGVYHARVRHGGKLYRGSVKVKDLVLAKRKLPGTNRPASWQDRADCVAGENLCPDRQRRSGGD